MKNFRSSSIAMVLLLPLVACSDDDSSNGASAADSASDAETDSLSARPELDWRSCGAFEDRNLECAEVLVPIDYEQPDGEKLPIAMRRILADPLEPYHGVLLFNPGGPGGEGIDQALSLVQGGLFDVIAPGYDIVGFDPRGVASSGAMGCGAEVQNMFPGAAPGEPPVVGSAEYLAFFKAQGERCERAWGPLFRELGSNNVVRDLEEMRKALGQPVLNFLGESYGTLLAALYAHEYPETTGRMVLDGAVQPRASVVEDVRGQFYETVRLHEAFFAACENGTLTCPPNARQLFDQAVQNARQRGIERAFLGTWRANFASSLAPQIMVQALGEEALTPGGDWILPFSGADAADEADSSDVVLVSVNCTDDNFEPPSLADLENLRAEFAQVSPLFTEGSLLFAGVCAAWPTTRDPVPLPTALDAPPLLVIGGTADSRTPYQWARELTEALGNATLLTSNHFGHVALAEGGDCVKFNVRAYLTSGSLPASGAVCD